MVTKMRILTYEERLKRFDLLTLEERRGKEDLIAVYPIMKEIKTSNKLYLLVWDDR